MTVTSVAQCASRGSSLLKISYLRGLFVDSIRVRVLICTIFMVLFYFYCWDDPENIRNMTLL